MNNNSKIYLSKHGIKELKKKINKLSHEQKMLELELRNSDVKEDNMLQIEVLARLDSVRSEIAEKQLKLKNAKILPKKKSIIVSLGSIVELIDNATGKIFKYQVVDSIEADPLIGKISSDSPLGKSLLGKKANEMINWSIGVKNMQMQLITVA
ncbi:Transcript cleavage factor greA [Chlamydia trachomatis]|nr:Transcript cleavage factor greA [Chlamydia trachomatis]